MKLLLASILLSTFSISQALASDVSYEFTKDFSLIKAIIVRNQLQITVEHGKTEKPTSFKFVPNPTCIETFPQQCSGVVVKLDLQSIYADEDFNPIMTESVIKIDALKMFGKDTDLKVIGPDDKEINVKL